MRELGARVEELEARLADFSAQLLALMGTVGENYETVSSRMVKEVAAIREDIKLHERWIDTMRPGIRLRHCKRCGRQLADYEKGEFHASCRPGGPLAP